MSDQIFRWTFAAIFLGMFFISGSFRRRARSAGEVIPRVREGKLVLFARMLLAAPLYLSYLAYMINPRWIDWSSVALPTWLRVIGVLVGIGLLPLLLWVMRSIGENISETYLTKESHELVTHGPYRWVRHPLYAVASGSLISLSMVAGNWWMLAMAFISLIAILVFVIPREEAELTRRFGEAYRMYMAHTGKLTPRLR